MLCPMDQTKFHGTNIKSIAQRKLFRKYLCVKDGLWMFSLVNDLDYIVKAMQIFANYKLAYFMIQTFMKCTNIHLNLLIQT